MDQVVKDHHTIHNIERLELHPMFTTNITRTRST